MRKISAFIICAATVLSLFAFGSSAAKSNVYYCPKAKTVPTIDGNITESEWNDALTIELDSLNAKAANGWAMICAAVSRESSSIVSSAGGSTE